MFGEGALALGGGLGFKSHNPRCVRIFFTISGNGQSAVVGFPGFYFFNLNGYFLVYF